MHGGLDRRHSSDPSDRFVRHHLAVADVHVLLRQHQRIEAIENIRVDVEPAAWRRYHGAGGEARWLKPDLYAEITTTEFVDRLFIEVDLGTESIPALLAKCEQYETYRRSGVEQHRHGSVPLVLWLFVDPVRAATLRTSVTRATGLTDAMYRYATPDTLTRVVAGGSL